MTRLRGRLGLLQKARIYQQQHAQPVHMIFITRPDQDQCLYKEKDARPADQQRRNMPANRF